MLGRVLALLLVLPLQARAEGNCTTVDIDLSPAVRLNPPDMPPEQRFDLQIVAWLEKPDGTFVDTMVITQETGAFGLGNRPGRFDFNSAPGWPYGRREVFPVWSHRHGLSWPLVVFQPVENATDLESQLSHPLAVSSLEFHYCRPQIIDEEGDWDAITDATSCASTVHTDKGRFDRAQTSRYPPRNDLTRYPDEDSPDVDLFATMNPFDAVSAATPASGSPGRLSWPVPQDLALGDYVVFVEVAREFDPNASYNFLSPTGIPFARYGKSYRGQPSIVYRIPFTIGPEPTTARVRDYAGYGDPDGNDGAIRPPDATISLDIPGSGAARLSVIADAEGAYRLRLTSTPQVDFEPPAAAITPQLVRARSTAVTVGFLAPGDDGTTGNPVTKYEVRYRLREPITEENFATSTLVTTRVVPAKPGAVQIFELPGLLPETDYTVAIRAVDDCRNVGPLATLAFTTPEREAGNVDACFIATAAYGSVMAADVGTLRRFRDGMLRGSVLGELAVEAYYTFGPSLSGVVGESDLLRATAREILSPVVARVRHVQVR